MRSSVNPSSILLVVFVGSIVGSFAKQQFIRRRKIHEECASVILQKWWRGVIYTKRIGECISDCIIEENSSITIQRWWKRYKKKRKIQKYDSSWTFLFG